MEGSSAAGMRSEDKIAALYQRQGEAPALVSHGLLPKRSRQGAPDWEKQARQRMHDLLQPGRGASVAEQSVLRQAGIALVHREDGKVGIDPTVARESDQDAVERATGIGRLYGLAPESTPVIGHGILPKLRRQGAPDWENQARKRMHSLLQSRQRASVAEQSVLRQAGIALVHHADGKVGIDPTVVRETDQDAVERATGIGRLYGLAPESTPMIGHGILPKLRRQGAPDWENQARKRMHHLLQPKHGASVSEQRVLRQAGIALVHRKDGTVGIDPTVMRESEQGAAGRATGIGRLYGLVPESTALVGHGILPKLRREGAPDWEKQARQRMHDLLKPKHGASVSEQRVLRQAGIALVRRENGTVGIDPTVMRESEQDVVERATAIGRLYGLAPESTAVVGRGLLPKSSRKGAHDWENQARQRMHGLLKPGTGASVSEQDVLRQAGIALVRRENGTVGIDPTVMRESEQDVVERATAIGRLFGLAPESTAVVGHGILPKRDREGAPDWEKQARQRMHDLLKPGRGASASEQRVLRQAGIALVLREDGKVGIDRRVARESGRKRKAPGGSAVPSRPAVQRKTAQAADASGDIVLATAVSSWGPHTSGTSPAGPTTTTNQNQTYPLPMTTGPAAGSYLPDLPTPPQPQPGPASTTPPPQYPPGPALHYISGPHSYATHPGQNPPSAPQHRPAHPANAALTSYTLPPPSEHSQTSQPTPYRPAPRPLPPTTSQPGPNTTGKRTR
ncbi:hypothetical protein AB0L67_41725 [Streptomyces flaveolus]|uniref:hypothetical protein n=1 Tax=Streptomyces flaveolus TaxID=67297 RepID=UPI00343DD69A